MPVKNPDLLPLFDDAKRLLEPYADRLSPRKDEPGSYDLWSNKTVEIDGRTHKGIFFAGLIVQKSYVGFYYMPIYTDTEASDFFGPELLKLLKGKSCFYLKTMTPEIKRQMIQALSKGFALYEARGWV